MHRANLNFTIMSRITHFGGILWLHDVQHCRQRSYEHFCTRALERDLGLWKQLSSADRAARLNNRCVVQLRSTHSRDNSSKFYFTTLVDASFLHGAAAIGLKCRSPPFTPSCRHHGMQATTIKLADVPHSPLFFCCVSPASRIGCAGGAGLAHCAAAPRSVQK